MALGQKAQGEHGENIDIFHLHLYPLGRPTDLLANPPLHSFDIPAQLGDFDAQADALLAQQTGFGVSGLQIRFQLMVIFFQVNDPPFLGGVIFHFDIDAACADVRIYFSDLFANLFFIDHDVPPGLEWFPAERRCSN
jgi:hypothetical protein